MLAGDGVAKAHFPATCGPGPGFSGGKRSTQFDRSKRLSYFRFCSILSDMNFAQPLQRRTFLRGLGVTMALPFLEAMMPKALAAASAKAPVRMAFIYVPNGMHMAEWTPKQVGADYQLPYIMEPLQAH